MARMKRIVSELSSYFWELFLIGGLKVTELLTIRDVNIVFDFWKRGKCLISIELLQMKIVLEASLQRVLISRFHFIIRNFLNSSRRVLTVYLQTNTVVLTSKFYSDNCLLQSGILQREQLKFDNLK